MSHIYLYDIYNVNFLLFDSTQLQNQSWNIKNVYMINENKHQIYVIIDLQ